MPASPALFCALLVAATGTAPASAPSSASCPDADTVWAGVTALVGAARIPPAGARPPLTVDDLGARYRVAIAGRTREVDDETRDCARRAQVAAVFVALTLWPPEVAPPEPPPPPPVPPPPPRVGLRLEVAPWLGATVLGAPNRALMGGGLARVIVGGARLAAVAGVGAGWGATQADAPGRIRERRFPVDAGLRWGWRGPRVAVGLDVEVVATWLAVAPADGGAAASTLDFGGRLGAILALGGGRIAPMVGVLVDMSAAPRALAFEPDGVVGHASWVRAGAFVGVGGQIQ